MNAKQRATHYRRLIEGQQRSGETVAQFCSRRRMSRWTFYQWRKRLSPARQGAAASKLPRQHSSQSSFVPMTVQMAPPLLGGGMEIVLSRGISVRLGGVVDREQLRSVVEVLLESQRC